MEILDDKHEIFKIYSSSCSMCRNDFDRIRFTCRAFPKGIPDEILAGENKHLAPLKGQKNEIVFERE